MTDRLRLRAAVLGATLGVTATVGMLGSALQAPEVGATAAHRVGVVVDTGSGVISRCVRFTEDSLTGIDVLNRAGLAPVVRAFSGEGGGVCAINGIGCPADDSCLTCQAPNYWAYYRADAGAGGFTYSPSGAGNVAVTDGDVDGWRWGTGAGPGFQSIDQICPLTPPPTSTSTPHGGGGGGGPPGPGGGTDTGGSPPPGEPSGPTGTTVAGPTTTTVVTSTTAGDGRDADPAAGDDAEPVDGEETASRTPLSDSGSGDAGTWIAFVALLAGFGLAGWQIRRVRHRRT